jgi:hypothetical protein
MGGLRGVSVAARGRARLVEDGVLEIMSLYLHSPRERLTLHPPMKEMRIGVRANVLLVAREAAMRERPIHKVRGDSQSRRRLSNLFMQHRTMSTRTQTVISNAHTVISG